MPSKYATACFGRVSGVTQKCRLNCKKADLCGTTEFSVPEVEIDDEPLFGRYVP